MPTKSFPCKYIGLPLNVRAFRRVDIQPLIDKMGGKLAAWKGRLINKAGRLRLINSVLSSIPTYFVIVVRVQTAKVGNQELENSFIYVISSV